ncbi:unnamed protein product [Victoria cruziana]
MKEVISVNTSRGPAIDEVARVEHLKANSMVRVSLDDFKEYHHVCYSTERQRYPSMQQVLQVLPMAQFQWACI